MISHTEENYLKAIYKITERENKSASTNAIATEMNTAAASVTDMIKRLSAKDLLIYEKSKGVTLTTEGMRLSKQLIRKHRLWEVFLCERLGYSWDACHDLAEQLEHIRSEDLIDRLDAFLEHPKFDPHGDPIPDAEGNFTTRHQVFLSEMQEGESGVVVGVNEHSPPFLRFLDKQQMALGARLTILERFEFDGSIKILLNDKSVLTISSKVGQNLFIKK